MDNEKIITHPWRYEEIKGTSESEKAFILIKNDQYHSTYSTKEPEVIDFFSEIIRISTITINNINKTEREFKEKLDEFEKIKKSKFKLKKKFFNFISLLSTWAVAAFIAYFKIFNNNEIIDLIYYFFSAMGFFYLIDSILELLFL